MKLETSFILAIALSLSSCAEVKNLESFNAHDGAMWESFRITAVGDKTTICTRNSGHEPMSEQTFPFAKQERADIATILNRNGFLGYSEHYKPLFGKIFDGETLSIEAQFDGRKKTIFCNNRIPEGLRRVCREIIAYYKAKTPSPTSDGIRQPADGSPKPSM